MEKALFPRVGGDVIRHDFSVCLGSAHDASCRLLLPRDQDGVEAEGNTVAPAPPGRSWEGQRRPACALRGEAPHAAVQPEQKHWEKWGFQSAGFVCSSPPSPTHTHTEDEAGEDKWGVNLESNVQCDLLVM